MVFRKELEILYNDYFPYSLRQRLEILLDGSVNLNLVEFVQRIAKLGNDIN